MPLNFQRLEHVRIALALVAAVVTGGAALYGVYVNARDATAASYETLAPEINQLKQAVADLQQENQDLREALRERGSGSSAAPAAPTAARTPARRPRAQTPPAPRDAPPTATLPPEAPKPNTPSPAGTPPVNPPPAEPERKGGVQGEIERRVPIDFEKAREIWKDVKKNIPRRSGE